MFLAQPNNQILDLQRVSVMEICELFKGQNEIILLQNYETVLDRWTKYMESKMNLY